MYRSTVSDSLLEEDIGNRLEVKSLGIATESSRHASAQQRAALGKEKKVICTQTFVVASKDFRTFLDAALRNFNLRI
jgi:hypothetical protein